MGFGIQSRSANGGTIYELADHAGTVRAEVWPHRGFNCLRWQVKLADGTWGNILYAMPDWDANPIPTRSGHPILFPFPGRLRDGKLPANGTTYQLPLNDATGRHAIHGFTPRNAWRVTGLVTTPDRASISGSFDLPHDLPNAVGLWPSDFELTVTYHLLRDRLAVDAVVKNRGAEPLPFGLGYHPYFRLPGVNDADVGGHVLKANVNKVWSVDADNVPTGELIDVPAELDYRTGRAIGGTHLDNVLTGASGTELAILSHPDSPGRLRVTADAAFRELVLFTPAHRQAVAIEPYTCSADASNLAARGLSTGWLELQPGERWTGHVEYVWDR